MLELKNVMWTTGGGDEIIKGVDMTVESGALTVITGPNGGGKTSVAKLITGVEPITSGSLLLDGEDITALDMTERARRGIAYAFQSPVKFKGLTVRDMLELSAGGELSEDEACALLGKLGLCAKEYLDRQVDGSLSGGESKRIEIACVLANKRAGLMVFDEPEAGIDLWSFTNLIDAFDELKKERRSTLLVISHQERILGIADNIVVIADGRVRVAGSRADVLPHLLNGEMQSSCPLEKVKVTA